MATANSKESHTAAAAAAAAAAAVVSGVSQTIHIVLLNTHSFDGALRNQDCLLTHPIMP
jgi:hypothetical protein